MSRDLVHHSSDSLEAVEGTRDQRRLRSDCADAQADLSLRWSHKSYCRICGALAHAFYFWKYFRCILTKRGKQDRWSSLHILNIPVKLKFYPVQLSLVQDMNFLFKEQEPQQNQIRGKHIAHSPRKKYVKSCTYYSNEFPFGRFHRYVKRQEGNDQESIQLPNTYSSTTSTIIKTSFLIRPNGSC